MIGIEFQMQRAADKLTSSLTGTSVIAARWISGRADFARRRVLERCERLSPQMRRYLQVVESRTDDALSYRDLRAVTGAYERWAATVNLRQVAIDLRRSHEGCRKLIRQVEASYRVWWAWTETGRAWWIELTYRSPLKRTLRATLSGHVRVTGWMGDQSSKPDGLRRSRVLSWGGSSDDYGRVPPGESRQLVAFGHDTYGLDPYVSTAAKGTFTVKRVEVTTNIPSGGGGWWCSLPVPERS